MRLLNKSYPRLSWIVLSNVATIVLILSAPIQERHDSDLIQKALKSNPTPYSYMHGFFGNPVYPLVIIILTAGIFAEFRRLRVSAIINVTPFTVWLVLALKDPFYGKQLLVLIPLVVVLAVDLILYSIAFVVKSDEGENSG